jgi:hypothetical protein
MSSSFGAVTFGVLTTSSLFQDVADVTQIHIPGSDTTYFDVGGRIGGYVSLSLKLAEVDYESLVALIATQATLTFEGSDWGSALLAGLRMTAYLDKPGLILADADFITPTSVV